MPLLLEYCNDDLSAKLVFDDDGKTGYAYLIVSDTMVGDVWLYNVGDPPRNPEWPDREKMPFANPADYVLEEKFEPIDDAEDIIVSWTLNSDGEPQASLFLRGTKHAFLCPGSKPGWCRLSKSPSPIARPLNETN